VNIWSLGPQEKFFPHALAQASANVNLTDAGALICLVEKGDEIVTEHRRNGFAPLTRCTPNIKDI
jgi:hypothetical protein